MKTDHDCQRQNYGPLKGCTFQRCIDYFGRSPLGVLQSYRGRKWQYIFKLYTRKYLANSDV